MKRLVPPRDASALHTQRTISPLPKGLKAHDSPLLWKCTQRSSAGSQGSEPRPAQERHPTNICTGRKRAPDLCPPLPRAHAPPHPPEPLLPIALPDLSRWPLSHNSAAVCLRGCPPRGNKGQQHHPHPDQVSLKKYVCPGQEEVLFFF